jgi:hypothetical protein
MARNLDHEDAAQYGNLDYDDAAEYLKMSVPTLKRRVREGKVP